MDAVRVFDSRLIFLGEVDDYTSLIYARKWHTYGEFQITMAARSDLLEKGNIIMVGTDPEKSGIIQYVQYSDENRYVTVKGNSLLWLLSGRITVPPTGEGYDVISGQVEAVMMALVDHNAVDPDDSAREIPLLVCAEPQGLGGLTTWQTRYSNLLDDLTELSRVSGLGIRVDLDYHTGRMVFKVCQGVDRSADQTDRAPMIFSPGYDNVYAREYTINDTESRNTAYVAGQGEEEKRDIAVVGAENTGISRREVFVDARDLEDPTLLPARGKTKLADMRPVTSYECSVVESGYREDWELGDYVTIIDREYGTWLTTQVVEAQETADANGETVTPTFGTPEKTVAEKLSAATGNTSGGSGRGGTPAVPVATRETLGVVMVGENLGIQPDGLLFGEEPVVMTNLEIDAICT